MAGVLTRKRYELGGTLTLSDNAGMPVELRAGDPAPAWLLSRLTPGELGVHIREGRLREVGASPPPRPAPEPPTPPTALEILRRFDPRASLDGDRITSAGAALRGADFVVVDKPREMDFQRALDTGTTIPVVVHLVDGRAVASLDLNRLCGLLAARNLVR